MPEGSLESSIAARVVSVQPDLELLRSGVLLMARRAVGDADAAEEIAQETLARSLEVLRRPEKTSSLGAYVAGIARHVIADYFRARARVTQLDDTQAATLRDESHDALALLCSEGEAARVRAAVGALAEEDRDLIRLCFYDGLEPAEIAARLGVPAERIRQRKLRALRRLRDAFDGTARHADPVRTTESAGILRVVRSGGAE